MRLFVETIVGGVLGGCIIALLAAGITIVYRSTRVVNLAQGALATLCTYLYYQASVTWGLPAALALPAVLVAGAGIGVAAETIAIRPLARAQAHARTVATIGLLLIVQWIVLTLWGAQQRFLPLLVEGGVTVAGVRVSGQNIGLAVATIAVGAGIALVFNHTRFGLALAAAADDPDAARLAGVGPRAVSRATFAIAGFVGALAGILATPLLVLTPSQMTLVGVVALGAALAGGFRSLPVTIAAGLGLGVVQSLVAVYAPLSGLPQAAGFLAVLVLLAVARRRIDLVEVLRGTA
jgi:branched-subunit amino acid ABC-type transport system permease component